MKPARILAIALSFGLTAAICSVGVPASAAPPQHDVDVRLAAVKYLTDDGNPADYWYTHVGVRPVFAVKLVNSGQSTEKRVTVRITTPADWDVRALTTDGDYWSCHDDDAAVICGSTFTAAPGGEWPDLNVQLNYGKYGRGEIHAGARLGGKPPVAGENEAVHGLFWDTSA
ncbi:hypothetical protein [Fodinicola acaciae]|uniref:hypothetical protein n=1 Tax=Fodinicola acaciae TaxID=2681555 RepID=UPI0013D4A2A8|nr:hypothetical protein [Fodinicola acaciae]